MRGNARPLKLLAAWCLSGCGDALPSPSRVDSLRLFALTTDTPEVLPGTDITVRAVWYAPTGGAPRFLWRLCPEPASGDARACARPDGGLARAVSDNDALTLSSREITLAEGVLSASWVVYVALCAEGDPVYDTSLEHSRCVRGDAIEAVRRVIVRRASPLNQNPTFANVVLSAGASSQALASPTRLSCDAVCDAWTVSVDPAPDASEPGETLMASFYATEGVFDAPRAIGAPGVAARLSTAWRPTGVRSGAEVLMWLVLRDQRGGESVRRGSVIVP